MLDTASKKFDSETDIALRLSELAEEKLLELAKYERHGAREVQHSFQKHLARCPWPQPGFGRPALETRA